jgi:glycosyltransferase involved in cell wall biosynthesis
MDFLLIHRNFPAQFRNLATALAARGEHRVFAIGSQSAARIPGVKLSRYRIEDERFPEVHPFARQFDLECRRAEQVLYGATALKSAGLRPDVIFVHPGWGEGLAIRDVFPHARLIAYCEFYHTSGHIGFDPEFPTIGLDGLVLLRARNAANLMAVCDADAGVAPTQWQQNLFPPELRPKIRVIHDGIDTDVVRPDSEARFAPSGTDRTFRAGQEIISFVAPNLEPSRGYHVFMRALPQILAARPKAQVIVVGGDGAAYGPAPPPGYSWKRVFFEEVRDRIGPERVSFIRSLPYADYLALLQVSRVHVYLTYPIILSRSLLEAMATECLVIASDTAPVREVISDGENGQLVPFFDHEGLARAVIEASKRHRTHPDLRRRARQTVLARYDLHSVCLPQQLALLGVAPEAAAAPVKQVKATRKKRVS